METRRQLVHLSGFLFVIFVSYFDKAVAVSVFGIFALFFLGYSLYIRSQQKKISKMIEFVEAKIRNLAYKFEREEDFQNPFKGAFFFYGSCTLTFMLFPFEIALAACSVLAVGDAMATLIGIRFGKRRINDRKSLEGSLAFFFSSLAAAAFFVDPVIALAGVCVGALVEIQNKVNDNIAIPLVSAFVMYVVCLV
jgi:dolichol kinase